MVAMKKLKLDSDPQKRRLQLARTKNEFEILKKLHDSKMKGIPKYYEFKTDAIWTTSKGKEELISYVTMEFIDGIELSHLIES